MKKNNKIQGEKDKFEQNIMSPWKSSLLNDNGNIEIIIFITNS